MQLILQAEWAPFGVSAEALQIAGLAAYVWERDGVWMWEVHRKSHEFLQNKGGMESKAEAKDDAEAFIRETLATQLVAR